jgi:hypothetical protein
MSKGLTRMNPRAELLVEKLSRGLSKSLERFHGVEPSMWEDPIFDTPEPWKLKDLVAHFIYSEDHLLSIAKDIASGGEGFQEGVDIDAFNAKELEKFATYSVDELLDSLEAVRNGTIEWVRGLSEAELDRVGMHPVLGQSNVETVVHSIYAHQLLHMREIATKMNK